jgi:hypothetical protein
MRGENNLSMELFVLVYMGQLEVRTTSLLDFTVWSRDVIHATFWKPTSSNLFAAAADLDKEGKIISPILWLWYKSQGKLYQLKIVQN